MERGRNVLLAGIPHVVLRRARSRAIEVAGKLHKRERPVGAATNVVRRVLVLLPSGADCPPTVAVRSRHIDGSRRGVLAAAGRIGPGPEPDHGRHAFLCRDRRAAALVRPEQSASSPAKSTPPNFPFLRILILPFLGRLRPNEDEYGRRRKRARTPGAPRPSGHPFMIPARSASASPTGHISIPFSCQRRGPVWSR